MPLLCHLDEPTIGAYCDPLSFFVRGWVHDPDGQSPVAPLAVFAGEHKLGESFALAERPDVSAALKLPAATRTGFRILCQAPWFGAAETTIEVRAYRDGEFVTIATRNVRFIGRDYRQAPFGHVLGADFLPVVHREHVYVSGPSWSGTNKECLALIEQYVGRPPKRILDVGCGLGAYGRQLIPRGYDWLGVEIKDADLAELDRLGLPHQRVDGRKLPFGDGTFDAALCIEVLEHIEDTKQFLTEIRRVAPNLMVSVPNFEVVPYLSELEVIPWHLLEADHKNFFTRWSLGHLLGQFYRQVEVTAYHPMRIKTPDGVKLFYHLFASASA
jgi:2-polyprenyl-3-methyl-5-hydroxy-6-metoxy-1,4-benzoquinol methylase